MRQSVHNFIEKNRFFTYIDRVFVAISGGPDSMALLHYLWTHRDQWNISVEAVHINHQLRADEADADEAFVREECQEYGIPLTVQKVDVTSYANMNGMATQLAARELRYKCFTALCENERTAIVTAHHGDDQIETVMMKIVRGYLPLQGIGIKAVRSLGNGYLIRPFLGITKEKIENYCKEEHVHYRIDSSNHSDKYTRNRYRKELLPFIKKENAQAHVQIQRQVEWNQDDQAFLERLAEDAQAKVTESQTETSVTISQVLFLQLSIPLQRRVIHLILNYLYNYNSPFISSIHIEQIIDLLNDTHPSKKLDVRNGLIVSRDYQVCHFSKTDSYHKETGFQTALLYKGSVQTALGEISAYPFKDQNETDRVGSKLIILSKDVTFPLMVRSRLPGDRIEAKGMAGSKKLTRLFIDRKISQSLRDEWPVVVDADGSIIWVPLLMVSRKVEHQTQTEANRIVLRFKPADSAIPLINRHLTGGSQEIDER
ncbi:tRNA lysidine(34) synthetase TilS [Alkalihalobacillus pseudalcaliphilus]|uniref:tRNA lysidine(34) synthetase TilS n=1 Tax=Alkalihalobacillus pseudalcaliphilus TaxID=79884 RepID=UPI00069D8263|nr:tRNA lysidine(34) synthetase TilS [Alkalihalobacillus pseudalcaliphilus]